MNIKRITFRLDRRTVTIEDDKGAERVVSLGTMKKMVHPEIAAKVGTAPEKASELDRAIDKRARDDLDAVIDSMLSGVVKPVKELWKALDKVRPVVVAKEEKGGGVDEKINSEVRNG